MKHRYLTAALLICGCFLYAQDPIGKIQSVADKIVRNTKFDFQLELAKPNNYFDFIEVIDFSQSYSNNKGVAFAYSEIQAPSDQSIDVQVSHNDALIILLNGKQVYSKEGEQEAVITRGERGMTFENIFPLDLKKGQNEIILKSFSNGEGKWIVYLQPSGALVFDERGKENTPKIGLKSNPSVTTEVAQLSNWLITGPFKGSISDSFGPESGLRIGQVYDGSLTWSLPKINVLGNVMNRHPLWGGYTNFNYHTAGVAWGMMHLGNVTGNSKYDQYAKDYTDFHITSRPFIKLQVYELNGFKSANHHLFETPLLDFTLAPALPYIYRLIQDETFDNRDVYENWIQEIIHYAMNEQIRSPDGHFWRYTPKQFTTWTDDMFMGLPFLMHAAEFVEDTQLKEKLLDDASSQIFTFNKKTYNKKDKLYQHAQFSEEPVEMPYWTRANGWGIWATVEVLLRLPENHRNYKKILKHFQEHVASVVKYQNERGFWYNVIDEPQTNDETSGTAIITLAIARGINQGWLDRKYTSNAINGWKALESMIEEDGTVHGICMGTMCSTDLNYYQNRPILDDDSHGILGLIFAAIEVDRLMNLKN